MSQEQKQASVVSIEVAGPEDAAAIAEIGARTFRASFAHGLPPADMDAHLAKNYTREAVAAELADSRSNVFFVARLLLPSDTSTPSPSSPSSSSPPLPEETEGQKKRGGKVVVVGFSQVKLDSTDAALPPGTDAYEINRLYVAVEHLSSGIGGRLMGHVQEWARSQGRAALWLGVWEHADNTQRFYRRWGFETIGTHEFVQGSTVHSDLVMLKRF